MKDRRRMPFSSAEARLLVTIPITTIAAARISHQPQERLGTTAFGVHAEHRRFRRG